MKNYIIKDTFFDNAEKKNSESRLTVLGLYSRGLKLISTAQKFYLRMPEQTKDRRPFFFNVVKMADSC